MTDTSRDYLDRHDFADVEAGPSFLEWTEGMSANRPEPTSALDGTHQLHRSDGAVLSLTLSGGTATWSLLTPPPQSAEHDWATLEARTAPAEVLSSPSGAYFIDVPLLADDEKDATDLTLVIDLPGRRGLVVYSWTFVNEQGIRRVASRIDPVGIGGPAPEPIARTTDLVGRRAMWVYSDHHAYEHIYLNAGTYAWHCLAGPERSIADVDRTEIYKVNDDAYLFFVTETVMPWDGVMLLDFTPGDTRNIGRFFGWDPKPDVLSHTTFGARGRILNQTDYSFPL